jgi:hypothetical protein
VHIDPRDYWKTSHHVHRGLRSVGNVGCSDGDNRWLYSAKQRVFLREATMEALYRTLAARA